MSSVTDPAPQPPEAPAEPQAYPAYEYRQPDRFTRFLIRVQTRTPRWLAPVAILGCVAAASGYVLVSNPTQAGAEDQPTCLVKFTTGFDCPGCGGTRAFWYMLHGDLPAAARHHAILVFVAPFIAYLYVQWAGRSLFGWRLPRWEPSSKTLIWFLVAWGVFSVLRNLPWEPFTWLFV